MVSKKVLWKLLIKGRYQMKFQHLLFIVVMIVGTSCVKNTEKEESNYREYSFTVNISESDSSFFENSIHIDLSSNEFLVDNFSNVVGYKVAEIKFQLSDFTGNENAISDFEIGFSHLDQSIGNTLLISEINLNEFASDDAYLYVNLNPSTVALAEEVMNHHHKITLDISANVSDKPVSFSTTFFVTIVIRTD